MDKKKRLIIIIAVSVLAVIIAGLVVFFATRGGSDDPVNTPDATDSVADTLIEPVEDTEESVAEDTTEEVSADTAEDTAEVTTDEVTEEPVDTTTADTTTAPPADTQAPQQSTSEGSAEQPYLVIPDENMIVTTVTVPAWGQVHYDIYRVGSMILTINDPNVYVIHGGYQYDSDGSKVAIMVDYALASDAVSFVIGNNSATPKSYKLVFTNPVGSYANPEAVSSLAYSYPVSLYETDTDQSYYFKYVAEKAGTITFSMEATADSSMSIQRNTMINGELIPIVKTTEADGTVNGNVKNVSIEVSKGDELLIIVSAIPNARGKYPATDITWWGNFN